MHRLFSFLTENSHHCDWVSSSLSGCSLSQTKDQLNMRCPRADPRIAATQSHAFNAMKTTISRNIKVTLTACARVDSILCKCIVVVRDLIQNNGRTFKRLIEAVSASDMTARRKTTSTIIGRPVVEWTISFSQS
uniref:Uncharacterized protein n=1 Tax=Arion vulgaris TaxID=1028688 RepID=A0A0B6ZK54_9EUPU